MKLNKRKILLAVLIGSVLVLTTSLAYFVASIANPASTDVDLKSEISQKFIFTPGTPINITANQTNFGTGDESIKAETTSSATLIADSALGSATEKYNVYFNINSNDFEYTIDNNNPEILLSIIDPSGTEIESIDGLVYKSITDVKGKELKGFDITTKNCIVKIAEDYAISTANSEIGTTQNWKVIITFVNLNSDQVANEGKTLSSTLILQEDKLTSGAITASESIILSQGGSSNIININDEDMSGGNFKEMYSAADDYGTSYFYVAQSENKWVKFADLYWQILRINGDGTIRMIYAGQTAPLESEKLGINGTQTSIGESKYSSDATVTLNTMNYLNSDTKNLIDQWYTTNLNSYDQYIADSIYCNNKEYIYETSGSFWNWHYFDGYYLFNNGPINFNYNCSNKEDSFTVEDTTNGNGLLTYKVGMPTIEDVMLTYLGTGINFTTMTPMEIEVSYNSPTKGFLTGVSSNTGGIAEFNISDNLHIRPVVSLQSNITFNGTGQWNDPYTIGEPSMNVCTI